MTTPTVVETPSTTPPQYAVTDAATHTSRRATLDAAFAEPRTGHAAAREFIGALRRTATPDARPALVRAVTRSQDAVQGGRVRQTGTRKIFPGERQIDLTGGYADAHVAGLLSACVRDPRCEAYISVAGYRPGSRIGRGANPDRPTAAPRGTAEEIAALPGVWLDVDFAGSPDGVHAVSDAAGSAERNWTLEELLDALAAFPLGMPSIVVLSGYGAHAYFLYDGWLAPAEDAEPRLRLHAWWAAYAADRGLHHEGAVTLDVNRVLRIPGSSNRKSGKPVPVTLAWTGDARYAPRAFSVLPEPAEADRTALENGGRVTDDADTPWGLFDRVEQAMLDLLAHLQATLDYSATPAEVTLAAEYRRGGDGHLHASGVRSRPSGKLLTGTQTGKILYLPFSVSDAHAELGVRTGLSGTGRPLTASDLWSALVPPNPSTGEPDRGLAMRILARSGPEVPDLLAAIAGRGHDELRAEYPSRAEREAQRGEGLSGADRALVAQLNGAAGAAGWALDTAGIAPAGADVRRDGPVAYEVRGLDILVTGEADGARTLRAFGLLEARLGTEAALAAVRQVVAA